MALGIKRTGIIERTIRNIPDNLEDFVTARNKKNNSIPKQICCKCISAVLGG